MFVVSEANQPNDDENRFATFFRISPAAITISRLTDGRYLEVNERFCALVGYPRADVVGRSALALGIWVDPSERARLVELLTQQTTVRDFEALLRASTGEIRHVLISGELVELEGERCLLAMTLDVTARRQAEHEAERLYQASAALNLAQTYDDVLTALRRYTLAGSAQDIHIALFDHPWTDEQTPEWLEVIAHWTTLPADVFPVRYAVTGLRRIPQLRDHAPIIIEDVAQDMTLNPLNRTLYLHQGVRSGITAPLFAGEACIGSISALYTQPTRFPESEVRQLMAVSELSAVKIQNFSLVAQLEQRVVVRTTELSRVNAQLEQEIVERKQAEAALQRLFAETQQRANEFAALYETARELAAQHDWSALLRAVLDNTMKLLGANIGGIFLYDVKRQELELAFSYDSFVPLGTRFRLGEGLAGIVAQTRQPLIVNDYEQWMHRLSHIPPDLPMQACGVPLLYAGELIGALTVGFRTASVRHLTDDDVRLLSLLASLAASSVQGARLYEAAQRELIERQRAEEALRDKVTTLEVLAEIDRDIIAATDSAAVMQSVCRHTRERLHTAKSAVLSVAANDTLQLVAHVGVADAVTMTERLTHLWRDGVLKAREVYTQADHDPTETTLADVCARERIGAYAITPLRTDGHILGLLLVMDEAPRVWNDDELRTLKLLAGQTAIAFDKLRLFEAVQQRAREFEALYHTAQDLSEQQDLPSLLTRIVERAVSLVKAAQGGICLYDPTRGDLELVSSKDTSLSLGARFQMGEGVIGQAALMRQTVIVNDYRYWEHRVSPERLTAPLQAAMGVPLLYQGELIGALALGGNVGETQGFTETDARLLSLFAAQAADAVHDARLLEETKRRAEEFETLYQTAQDLTTQQDLETLLKIIVERAVALLKVHSGFMMMYDRERELLQRSISTNSPVVGAWPIKLGEGLAGRVAQTRQPLLISDYQHWEHRLSDLPIAAALAVPVVYQGDLIGVLGVQELGATPTRQFTSADVRLLELFAAQAAGAVHNAWLLEETKRRAEEFQTLYEVVHDLAAQQDLQTLLNMVVERAMKLFQVPNGFITLYDRARHVLALSVDRSPTPAVGLTFQWGEGMVGRVAQTRQPMIINDYEHWEHHISGLNISAIVQAPLSYGGELIGTLGVNEFLPATRSFTSDDVRLLELFAAQVASAIHNARLREQTVRQLSELSLLYETALVNMRTTPPQLEKALQPVIEALCQLMRTPLTAIYLWEDDITEGFYILGTAVPSETISTLKQMIVQGQGIMGWVATHGESLNIPDIQQDRRYVGVFEQTRSELCVPVKIGEQTVGVINVESERANVFEERDVRLMTTLAAQLAGVVENARLYHALQKRLSELQSAQAQLARAARLAGIGELAASIAHEINNPLAAILGFSELAYQSVRDEDIKSDLEMVVKEANRVREIVRGLLDFARPRALRLEVTDVNQVIADTLKLVRHRINRGGLRLHEHYDAELPLLELDANQIKQVLLNLITNAIQATASGGALTLATALQNQAVVVSVQDTGTGIAPEHLEHIFEPFFTTKAEGEGTGLGLAVSYGIVQKHGGRIEAESEVGKGTTFKVYLPIGVA
jgi:PAS domain S-box-containing protein